MIKKRHIFYIIYILITVSCMAAALVFTPITRQYGYRTVSPSARGDIMLIITAILIVIALIFIIVRKVYIQIHEAKEQNRKK